MHVAHGVDGGITARLDHKPWPQSTRIVLPRLHYLSPLHAMRAVSFIMRRGGNTPQRLSDLPASKTRSQKGSGPH